MKPGIRTLNTEPRSSNGEDNLSASAKRNAANFAIK